MFVVTVFDGRLGRRVELPGRYGTRLAAYEAAAGDERYRQGVWHSIQIATAAVAA